LTAPEPRNESRLLPIRRCASRIRGLKSRPAASVGSLAGDRVQSVVDKSHSALRGASPSPEIRQLWAKERTNSTPSWSPLADGSEAQFGLVAAAQSPRSIAPLTVTAGTDPARHAVAPIGVALSDFFFFCCAAITTWLLTIDERVDVPQPSPRPVHSRARAGSHPPSWRPRSACCRQSCASTSARSRRRKPRLRAQKPASWIVRYVCDRRYRSVQGQRQRSMRYGEWTGSISWCRCCAARDQARMISVTDYLLTSSSTNSRDGMIESSARLGADLAKPPPCIADNETRPTRFSRIAHRRDGVGGGHVVAGRAICNVTGAPPRSSRRGPVARSWSAPAPAAQFGPVILETLAAGCATRAAKIRSAFRSRNPCSRLRPAS